MDLFLNNFGIRAPDNKFQTFSARLIRCRTFSVESIPVPTRLEDLCHIQQLVLYFGAVLIVQLAVGLVEGHAQGCISLAQGIRVRPRDNQTGGWVCDGQAGLFEEFDGLLGQTWAMS